MKQKELSKEEKELVNGGSSFSTSSAVNIGGDSLLSLSYNWKSGDHERTYTLEAGKDIDFNVQADLNKIAE